MEGFGMEMSLLNIAYIVAGFIALLFILFLLTTKTERNLPNFMLAAYLLLFSLDTLSQFNIHFLYPISPIAGMLISLSVYLMMPALFLFVKSSIFRDFNLSPGSLVHILPYVLVILLLGPGYFLVHLRGNFTQDYATEFTASLTMMLAYILVYVQVAIYAVWILSNLHHYKQLLIENYSNPNMGNHRWLLQFFLLVLVLNFIGLVKNVLRISSSEIIFNYAAIAVVIGILMFVSWVLIKSLRQPGVFTGVYSDMQLVKRMLMEPESGTKVSDESLRLIQKIKVHMEEQEPYLDSSLSMYDLAGQLNMKVKELSVLINHTLNQHFFDFVNQYRINRASEILSDPDNKQVTVLEVLYEVGFNSKSSFNTTFKKLTGQTPTQFRKSSMAEHQQ